jgi:hypothetical protein
MVTAGEGVDVQRDVMIRGNVTSVYPPLKAA